MDQEVDALLKLKVVAHPKDPKWLEAQLQDALADIIYGNQESYPILRRVTDVGEVKILEPGQGYIYSPSGPTGKTEEIVDEPTTEPAAAGEGKTLEEIFGAECLIYLRQEQRNRVAILLKNWLAPTAAEVWAARLSPTTGTLIAYIRFQDSSGQCTEQWYTQTLLPETIAFILGEDEEWDPTKM